MNAIHGPENHQVIVIGAGQAGLSAGYFLKRNKIDFIILDACKQIGDSWRNRWDSLKLFTPAKFDGLAGMPFPADPNYFPTKDEMGDYLENYAKHFKLPVRTDSKVEGLSKEGNKYCIQAGHKFYLADHVIIAMSNYQNPRIPKFAKELNPEIIQLHSLDYRDQSQLKQGGVLVVGAGNSGAEIALECARNNHQVWLSGRDTGHIPFNIESTLARIILVRLVLRFLFHQVFTLNTPAGKKIYPKVISQGGPLIRIKPKQFTIAGIERVPRVTGVQNGTPQLENGVVPDIKNVVWCTGFYPSFSWIDIPVFKDNEPVHVRGVVKSEPGLYFVGFHFLYSFSSTMIHGIARDAKYVVNTVTKRLGIK